MDKLIDAALGIHPKAMEMGAKRLEVLATNISNSDTPGYKARDIDFRTALNALIAEDRAGTLARSEAGHMTSSGGSSDAQLLYRVPNLPSLDGNTVDSDLEQAAFSEAQVRYQASIDFLDARVQGLRKALRGE